MENLSMQKEPPNSPLVHTKSKWKKEWPQWGKGGGGGGGGFMEGDDRYRYIYVCVKQKWNKKKWNIYAASQEGSQDGDKIIY